MNKQDTDIEKLKHGLDVFGADLAHWPGEEGKELAERIKTNAAAQVLLAKARALDEVLGCASRIKNTEALKARLMEAALNVQPEAKSQVIAFPAAPVEHSGNTMRWGAAALLAASLALGMWTGASGIIDAVVSAPLTIAGLESVYDLDEFYKSGLSAAEDLL